MCFLTLKLKRRRRRGGEGEEEEEKKKIELYFQASLGPYLCIRPMSDRCPWLVSFAQPASSENASQQE